MRPVVLVAMSIALLVACGGSEDASHTPSVVLKGLEGKSLLAADEMDFSDGISWRVDARNALEVLIAGGTRNLDRIVSMLDAIEGERALLLLNVIDRVPGEIRDVNPMIRVLFRRGPYRVAQFAARVLQNRGLADCRVADALHAAPRPERATALFSLADGGARSAALEVLVRSELRVEFGEPHERRRSYDMCTALLNALDAGMLGNRIPWDLVWNAFDLSFERALSVLVRSPRSDDLGRIAVILRAEPRLTAKITGAYPIPVALLPVLEELRLLGGDPEYEVVRLARRIRSRRDRRAAWWVAEVLVKGLMSFRSETRIVALYGLASEITEAEREIVASVARDDSDPNVRVVAEDVVGR